MTLRNGIRGRGISGKCMPVVGLFALLAALAVLASPAKGQSGMATSAPKDRLFSHEAHASTVKLKCARCHASTDDGEWVQKGKKEHARCFDCHKFSSSCGTLAQKEGKVCATCHITFKSSCMPAGYDRPDADPEYRADYSHKLHIRPSAKTGEQCEQCHGSFGSKSKQEASLAAGHALCAGCHARGVTPRIKESCDGCHIEKKTGDASVAGSGEDNPYSVKGAFDHVSHAREDRVGTAGQACLTCHSNIKTADSNQAVPMPTMQGCTSSCHNGEKAFNAIGATCTRCHTNGGR